MTDVKTMPDIGPFSLNAVPTIAFGPGRAVRLRADIKSLALPKKAILVVVDSALVTLGVAKPVLTAIEASGARVVVYSDIAGEPKMAQIDAVADLARSNDVGLVICIGGGTALDIGKTVAAIAVMDPGVMHYALGANPLPPQALPKICIPTTAGTGSELSATNIFTGPAGKKLWVNGQQTKPERVILDPELTVSLPPSLTAWCGLDAFVHAFESCTNRRHTDGNDMIAHYALRLIVSGLYQAVHDGANIGARGRMLLGSAYAGIAIDNCGTAFAHNISHALAGLAPVHHGFATALGFETTLGWLVDDDTGPIAAAAAACGRADIDGLADWFSDYMTQLGIARRLPEAFAAFTAADLAREMRSQENLPMRLATARTVTEADIDRFAAAIMAMA